VQNESLHISQLFSHQPYQKPHAFIFFQLQLANLHHYNLTEGYKNTLAFKVFSSSLAAMTERIQQANPPRRSLYVGYSRPQPKPDARSTVPEIVPRVTTGSPTEAYSTEIAETSSSVVYTDVVPVYSSDTEIFMGGDGLDWPRGTVKELMTLHMGTGGLSHTAIPASNRTEIESSNSTSGRSLDERLKDPMPSQAEIQRASTSCTECRRRKQKVSSGCTLLVCHKKHYH
jgi:hypothetical protein